MNSSCPDGMVKVIDPIAQLRAISRTAARNTAGAPSNSGRRRNARRLLAICASEPCWAKVMREIPERSQTTHSTTEYAGESRPRS
jgi:NADH:ubiquinone oxidoreductase subunit E